MTVYPVLQAFEKDQNKIIFAINQLSRGLSSGGGGGVPANMREPLTAARTYFVDTTGSDSNSGLTSGAPFLTVQRAVNAAYGEIDLKGFNVTIQLANGTYSGAITVPFPQIGAGTITINGNAASPTSTILSSTAANGGTLAVQRFATILIANLQIQATGANSFAIHSSQRGLVLGNKIEYPPGTLIFGAAPRAHMFAGTGGMVDLLGAPYSIIGNAAFHMQAETSGIARIAQCAVSIPANRTFTTFASASSLGLIQANITTYTLGGGVVVTGKQYDANYNGVITTNGGVLPGSAVGTTSFGGQFN